MDDLEKQKFENAFKHAFSNAEVSPSENVWTNIELDLERARTRKMKKRLVFYQTLAAASITFALCLGGIGYYTLIYQSTTPSASIAANSSTTQPPSDPLSTQGMQADLSKEVLVPADSQQTGSSNLFVQPQINAIAENSTTSTSSSSSSRSSYGKSSLKQSEFSEAGKPIGPAKSNKSFSSTPTVASATSYLPDQNAQQRQPLIEVLPLTSEQRVTTVATTREGLMANADRPLPKLYKQRNPQLQFPQSTADPVALMFARLADHERELASQEDKNDKSSQKKERLWTAVGVSAGAFNPVNSGTSSSAATAMSNSLLASSSSSNSSSIEKQAKAPGVSYSVGVSMGTQLSKRWILQGGFNYLTQLSSYTANQAVATPDYSQFRAASINEVKSVAEVADTRTQSKVVSTAPYTVNNNVQFVSVPVQAGYLITNKKFAVQLNGGISTDLFLQNTLSSEGSSINKTTVGRGDDSPYRSVNFSGLMGTEVSYKFSKRYRISLNPGVRYPFNSVFKSDYKTSLGISSMPLTFDVGLRFRYIFQ
jgi:hypothetical protein